MFGRFLVLFFAAANYRMLRKKMWKIGENLYWAYKAKQFCFYQIISNLFWSYLFRQ